MSSKPKETVRAGYDAVSERYRADDDAPAEYEAWIRTVDDCIPRSAHLLDLGCGCGVPVARRLTDLGHQVTGVDVSRTQITRARRLVPRATFMRADASDLDFEPSSFDAIVCLYVLIHLPHDEQQSLVHRIRTWLRSGGLFVATVGAVAWTGEERNWLGGDAAMWWCDPGADIYRNWFRAAGLRIEQDELVPEGDGEHQLFVAQAE